MRNSTCRWFIVEQDSLSAVSLYDWISIQKMSHTFFKALFFLKAYQNLYVKH